MDNLLDSGLEVSEFELQSVNYVHFQANKLGKSMNSFILQPSYLGL